MVFERSSHEVSQAATDVQASLEPIFPVYKKDILNSSLKVIFIDLDEAEVQLMTAKQAPDELKVELIAGEQQCGVELKEKNEILHVAKKQNYPLPVEGLSGLLKKRKKDCKYRLSLLTRQPLKLDLQLKKGKVVVQDWKAPLDLKMEQGELDLFDVKALELDCSHCLVTGKKVEGPIRYALDSGNVGLEGIRGSVDGRTLGDSVLHWDTIASEDAVKIQSRAGDVILFFPAKIALAVNIKAPRGEVFNKDYLAQRGIPVEVHAASGNVHLFKKK